MPVFLQQSLEITGKQFTQSVIYQCMDDILLPGSYANTLDKMFDEVKKKNCLAGDYKWLLKSAMIRFH